MFRFTAVTYFYHRKNPFFVFNAVFCLKVHVANTALAAEIPVALVVKRLLMQETQPRAPGRESHRNRKWQPAPVFLPGKPHRQRRLAGYSPWEHRVRHTERLGAHTVLLV